MTMLAALCLALIASVAAFPSNTTSEINKRCDGNGCEEPILIGYRAVSAVQATKYENGIYWDGPPARSGGEQLGQGIYLSYNMADYVSDYYCVFFADQTAWRNTRKIFVPNYWPSSDPNAPQGCEAMLWWSQANSRRDAGTIYDGSTWRPKYLASVGGPDYTIQNTAMIAPIQDALFNFEQLLIPPALIPTLSLQTQCTSAQHLDVATALYSLYGTVDWRDTFANVQGMQFAPSPPPAAPNPPYYDKSKLIFNYPALPGSPGLPFKR